MEEEEDDRFPLPHGFDSDNKEVIHDDEDDDEEVAVGALLAVGNVQVQERTPVRRIRRKWTNREKLRFVRQVAELRRAGHSQVQACRMLNINARQLRNWAKQVDLLGARRPLAMTLCAGMPGMLDEITDQLTAYVFELRSCGVPVRNNMIRRKAIALKPAFDDNRSRLAQEKVVERWVKKSPFVNRMGTRESQRDPKDIAQEGMDFIVNIARPLVSTPDRHEDYIINMDQTPIYFSQQSNRTLEVLGARTVHIRRANNDTKRCTYAAAITASGLVLTPYIIFKGARNGKIAKKLTKFPKTMAYACQPKAWMDEKCMLDWVDRVLKPHLNQAPSWVKPLLFLDAYRCHMMTSVVGSIQNLGCQVEHIPAGCTCVGQPVDVGFNKPLESEMRDLFESWMMADLIHNQYIKPPTRRQIVDWLAESLGKMRTQTVRNAWRFRDYAYFVPHVPNRPVGFVTPVADSEDLDTSFITGYDNIEGEDEFDLDEQVFDDEDI